MKLKNQATAMWTTESKISKTRKMEPLWTPAEKFLPPEHEAVLASDQGTHYVAFWDGKEWCDCSTDEPIDCVVTHWMWLPEHPECE